MSSEHCLLPGPVGALECVLDAPSAPAKGVAVICHPNPLLGGTLDNKVVQTLVRVFLHCGYRCVRFNFRGVGASQGVWADGQGEVDDACAVAQAYRQEGLALVLAGFSFGGYVACAAAARLSGVDRLVLIGPSTQKYLLPVPPAKTLVVHGELDDVVPLPCTMQWANTHDLPVVVVPGAGHFFHGKLTVLKHWLIAYGGLHL